MLSRRRSPGRGIEALLLLLVVAVLGLGLALTSVNLQVRQDLPAFAGLPALAPIIALTAGMLAAAHLLMRWRRRSMEQILLPVVALLFAVGLIAIYRVRGTEGAWQQLLRGFVPGMVVILVFIWRPGIVETDKAAATIARGIRKGRFLIAFPLRAYLAVLFVASLPQGLADLILRRMPAKGKL